MAITACGWRNPFKYVCPNRRHLHTEKPEPEAATFPLSPREREVLALIAQGHTNAEIADSMFISLRTITTHVTNIFGKLGVSNRTAASALARKHGLVADAD